MAANQLEKIFRECDVEGTGYLCKDGLRELCARVSVSVQDADTIFENLDLDGDGRISFDDISKGLLDFLTQTPYGHKDYDGSKTPDSEVELYHDKRRQSTHQAWQNFANEVEKSDKLISEERVFDLYKELQNSDRPQLISQFETIMQDLLENVRRLQEEKSQLEHSWRREKKENEKHLYRMEEEMTNQVQDLEQKVKQKAQREVEAERNILKKKMDAEMDELQAHLSLFEKVNSWLQSSSQNQCQDDKLNEIRSKLEEALHENHQLRMNLMDTQTNVALMRSEIAQLRSQYEEKCRELSSERERIMEVVQEHEILGRQLHLLHDANRKLHDTNDTLRGAMEYATPDPHPRLFPRSAHRGSIIGDYLQSESSISLEPSRRQRFSSDGDIIEECQEFSSIEKDESKMKIDDRDSGLSTLRDPGEGDAVAEELGDPSIDSQFPVDSVRSFHTAPAGCSTFSNNHSSVIVYDRHVKSVSDEAPSSNVHWDSIDSQSDGCTPRRKIADIKRQLGLDPENSGRRRHLTPSPVPLARKSIEEANRKWRLHNSSTPPATRRTGSECQEVPEVFGDTVNPEHKPAKKTNSEENRNPYHATGPPVRTYKVVFIGDAAVGKSSFILRLSKGIFVPQLSSTLGVDFQVKVLSIDGKNVALQLWDTAGQERFRSITQSYFRKTDGVMLLYDCTNEHSFLNVRQWMDAVDNVTSRKIPVMIVGNKTDLREVMQLEGKECVTFEDGEKLAKDFGAIFMEASAKDGCNVYESIAQLTRSMSTNEDLQVKSSVLLLSEGGKSSGRCCRK